MVIYLIGMMGSGKTTIGNILANKLKLYYLDTDRFIERKYQLTITSIVEKYGFDYFYDLEHQLLIALQNSYDIVISTGGGVVLNQKNISLMKNNGTIIYLKTSIDILKQRLNSAEISKRPLLKTYSIEEIYRARKELYQKASDIIVNCDNLTVYDICDIIVKKIKR